jgi:hypothetical protein
MSRMQRRALESTTMRSVGYDRTEQVLEVEFQSGAVYQYLNVPPAISKELLDAESKGQYFNSEIRDSYEFVRVERRERGATAHERQAGGASDQLQWSSAKKSNTPKGAPP